jgi:hypothetical protein
MRRKGNVRQKVHFAAKSLVPERTDKPNRSATIEKAIGLIMLEHNGFSSRKIGHPQTVFWQSLPPEHIILLGG